MPEIPDQDSQNPARDAPESGVDAKDELEEVKAELAKAKWDYLYLLAEFDNSRKNAIKERS